MKKSATARAVFALCRVVVVGDTCISEEGMATIVGRDKRYHVCGSAHGFYDARELIRKHRPDVLLIEPFWKIVTAFFGSKSWLRNIRTRGS